jgi:hypothetical protein
VEVVAHVSRCAREESTPKRRDEEKRAQRVDRRRRLVRLPAVGPRGDVPPCGASGKAAG